MLEYSYRRKLGTVRRYVPTGKDLSFGEKSSFNEQMWYQFAGMIEGEFGPEGGTPEEIYQRVTGPKGLTADATMELLYAAKRGGYLK